MNRGSYLHFKPFSFYLLIGQYSTIYYIYSNEFEINFSFNIVNYLPYLYYILKLTKLNDNWQKYVYNSFIFNIPFIYSNIPTADVYAWFIDRFLLYVWKKLLLKIGWTCYQGYTMVNHKLFVRMLYERHFISLNVAAFCITIPQSCTHLVGKRETKDTKGHSNP